MNIKNLHLTALRVRDHKKHTRKHRRNVTVQELCENGGGRPGLSVLTSRLISVDIKLF